MSDRIVDGEASALPSPSTHTRREFLRGAGATSGALILGTLLSTGPTQLTAAVSGRATAHITAWLRIGSDGVVTLLASQSEMGQGITTTLAAALAHELYLPFEAVRLEFAPFGEAYRDPVFNWMFTGNSQSTSSFHDIMRSMGAAAREMLLSAAAERLDVSASSLATRDGFVRHTASGRRVSFGEVAEAAARLSPPAKPVWRTDAPFGGQSLRRWDIPSKVDGSAVFGIDVKVPGMVVAAVRCAPRFGGQLARFDAAAIRARPGVIDIVTLPNGLAVVAGTYWQARSALSFANPEWTDAGSTLTCTHSLPGVYRERLATGPFYRHKDVNNVETALSSATRRVDAIYEIPFQPHATMEPMNCTAHVTSERCEIWVPTQGTEMSHNVAMRVTGLPSDRIVIHRTLLGGGFGRRLLADFLQQTLLVAMAVKRPVKLIWSREEDMTHDFYRPAMLHQATAGLDASGTVISMAHKVVSPSHMLYIVPRTFFPQLQDWTAPAALPEGMDTMAVEGLLEAPYSFASLRVEQHRLELDVPVSVWRTTGHGPNNFVLESFMDELAHAQGIDPMAFRLAAIGDSPRARRVLEEARARSGWSLPPPQGAFRGTALAAAFGGFIAAVVELSVRDHLVKIHRIIAVVDCGRTLDPGIATSNILGGIVWGLSSMKSSMPFQNGRAVHDNFDGLELLYLRETPPCEVHFVESGAKLGGTGELGPVPVHAAVCNAIFAATGTRIRTLPLQASGLAFA